MREFTAREQEKLMLAGEICYNELLGDINRIDMAGIPEFDEEKIRRAEQAAWQEVRVLERKRMIKRWGMVAAVFLVVVCSGVTAFALGYDPFGFRAVWNDDIFWFEDENVAEQMQELVTPYDDVENLLPKWIPGRYEVYEESLSDDDEYIDSYVVYANSETDLEDILYVGIWYWPNSPLYYQKDTQDVVIYTLNETDFYIMFDRDWTNVVWRNGQVEYYIMGRISEKEVKKMIKSIYN